MAMEELLIAEGSDWCWWYGPEHDSANRPEFDQLYRSHLANVYVFLNLAPPEELSRPILRTSVPEVHVPPSGPITPVIDGEVTSYFEWIGAGAYRVDERSGSMHGKKFVISEVLFGSDGESFYVRADFHSGYENELAGMEARLYLQPLNDGTSTRVTVEFANGGRVVEKLEPPAQAALLRVLEVRVPLKTAAVARGAGLKFQFSLWQGGLPIDAVPQQGWIEMKTTDPERLAE